MKDIQDKSNKKPIVSMTEEQKRRQISALEAERRECEGEIERILRELSGQTGMASVSPKGGSKSK